MQTPIRSPYNQYRGINAHLNSYLQATHSWGGFHTLHISHLLTELKRHLLPMGYTAEVEESLQIRRTDDTIITPRSDVTVYDSDSIRAALPPIPATGVQGEGTLMLPLRELLAADNPVSEKPYRAIAIYWAEQRRNTGQPIGWIELLSPSNKGHDKDALTYLAKRDALLETGIVFVEIDYLHELPPTFPNIADYTRGQPDSHPFRIVVLDPRPELDTGFGYLNEFDVDQPIPLVTLPLSGRDHIEFDFGIPYNRTFEDGFYGVERINYAELPMRFEQYRAGDQARIAARMLAVVKASQRGELSSTPPETDVTSLEDALDQLAQLTS